MYQCNNEKHNDDMKLIFAQQMFCENQSGYPDYDGETFSHCPFCGIKLEEGGIFELREFSKPPSPMLETTTYADIPPITNPDACNLVIRKATKQTTIHQPWIVGLSRETLYLACYYSEDEAQKALDDYVMSYFTPATLSDSGISTIVLIG